VSAENGYIFQDATKAKPMMVLMWIQILIERLADRGEIQPQKRSSLSRRVDTLLDAYQCIEKIDTMVLPFPYCQLLKIFTIFFCFTLPFVLSVKLAAWTPIVCLFTSMGFFGLDQVGAKLEQPFGTDPNDFPLLKYGKTMCSDLDAMVRTLERTRYIKRTMDHENIKNKDIAAKNLGWKGGPDEQSSVAAK